MYSPCSPSAPENMKCFYLFVPTKGPVSWNIDRDPIALSKTHYQGVMTCNPESIVGQMCGNPSLILITKKCEESY